MQRQKIKTLKEKLSRVQKKRTVLEKELLHLKRTERSQIEEYEDLKMEMEFLNEQIQKSIKKTAGMQSQMANIAICKASEIAKRNARTNVIDEHKKGFEKYFDKEKMAAERRHEKNFERGLLETEKEKYSYLDINKINEAKIKEVGALERECVGLELECTVLKKRNAAVLTVLRRNLLESENTRKNLMAQQSKRNYKI